MPLFILLGMAGLGIWMVSKVNSQTYPDIDPAAQGGGFSTDYDIFFETAHETYGVPFALLKAHSIQESSLNPNAFLDENPQQKPERQGWASRGLMQILWWPGSERFKKYGHPDESLGVDGIVMFQPDVNVDIAAQIIKDNIARAKTLRDAINMYNTGKTEAELEAPGNYVDKVLGYYSQIVNQEVH